MRYLSTRGQAPALNFEEVVLAGLASDGGLYVPESIPQFSMPDIAALRGMSYPDLAYEILSRFTGDTIPAEDLAALITDSYAGFRHAAIAPLKQLDSNLFLLELFHGPTLAFKDFALQFLGRLLGYFLKKHQRPLLVVGATSGDTGSAAIAGCAGRGLMEIVILHPKDRVSEVQRRQMTSVLEPNVHNIAVEGSFDDCQAIVKQLFHDTDFRHEHQLTAVNSINWARILAQVVYYFYAALALGAPARSVSFTVPTGNFGDIYAGYIARAMGLPIEQLVIATNRNDILARTLETGSYQAEAVVPSLSPSMDIQISSNFERLLFDLHGRDPQTVRQMMEAFAKDGAFSLAPTAYANLQKLFSSAACSDENTLATIRACYDATGELLDPHTAVGCYAAQRCRRNLTTPMVVLATAHPAKFPDAVQQATGMHPVLPRHLADLAERPERCHVLPAQAEAIKQWIRSTVRTGQ